MHVNLRKEVDESYDISIEPNLLERISHDLKTSPLGNKYAIVTDSNVRDLYGERLLKSLKKEGMNACLLDFPAGERSKNMETVTPLIGGLLENGLDRKSAVIALGGGVVGDVAGFTASIFMRGIPCIQVPTTLLAQVDSSIGGKTAVDTAEGKNLVGLFFQPKRVYIDPAVLNTLPKREFANGLAEVIKHGIIGDGEFFRFLEENITKIKKMDPEPLTRAIWVSCKIKKEVVEEDPKEENKRAILNYGHTVGHAIEAYGGYKKYLHGEAVAIGMNYAGRLAVKKGFWREDELERQNKLLKKASLPIQCDLDPKEIIKQMAHDKKAEAGAIMFVLPKGIGEMATVKGRYRIPVSNEELMSILKEKK